MATPLGRFVGRMKWGRPAPCPGCRGRAATEGCARIPGPSPRATRFPAGRVAPGLPQGPDPARLASRSGFQEAGAAAPAAPRASSAGGQGSRAGSGARAAGRGHCPAGGPRRPGGSSVTEVELCLATSGTTRFLMFSDSCLQRKEENT